MSTNDDNYLVKFLGQAKVILTGASDAELRVQLFDVLQDFFDLSNAWQEAIRFTVVPTSLTYPLEPLSGRILRLSNVIDQNNVAQQAVMPVPGLVQFLYPYSNVQPMTAIVVKNVTDPLDCFPPDFPTWLLPSYGIGLLSGVLGNMMAQPGQSYSNPQMGMFHLQKFRDAAMHARVAMMRMNTIGAQAWAYPQQFRVTGQKGGVSTFNVNPSSTTPR